MEHSKSAVEILRSYYTLMGQKSLDGAEKFLHPDIKFIGPIGEMEGVTEVLKGAEFFFTLFDSLNIREGFGSDSRAILFYDLQCPAPTGNIRVAVMGDVTNGLISRLELIYDPAPFINN